MANKKALFLFDNPEWSDQVKADIQSSEFQFHSVFSLNDGLKALEDHHNGNVVVFYDRDKELPEQIATRFSELLMFNHSSLIFVSKQTLSTEQKLHFMSLGFASFYETQEFLKLVERFSPGKDQKAA